MTLRRYYDERIEQIRSEIIRMGNIALDMIENAIQATLTGNSELAEEAILKDDEVDELEESVIKSTVLLVLQESPVASDLKLLTSTLGVIGEFEKIADDAVKLARRAAKIQSEFPGEMRTALMEMGVASRKALSSALRLYTAYDQALAEEIIESDETIDKMYAVACHRVTELIQENPAQTAQLLKIIDIFHALEHVADRAVAISKRLRVHYSDSGAKSWAS